MAPDISSKLKSHVSIIDERMKSAAAAAATQSQVYHTALPATVTSSRLPLLPVGTETNMAASTTAGPPVVAGSEVPFSMPPLDDWTFGLSPDQQLQLQSDLTTWPFDIGGGESGAMDPFVCYETWAPQNS